MTATVWNVEATLPGTANSLSLTPLKTSWFRVVAHFSDGSEINSLPFPVVVTNVPLPPINLKLLFASNLLTVGL